MKGLLIDDDMIITTVPMPRVEPVISFDEALPQAIALVVVDRIQQRLIEWPTMKFDIEAVIRCILQGIYQGPKQSLLFFEVLPKVQKLLLERELSPHPRLV